MTSGRDCCVYLLDGEGALALVDTGYGPSYKSLLANVIRLGFDPGGIERILLTHCHIDHVGGAHAFRSDYGSEIIAHRNAAIPLEQGDRTMTAAFLYGVRFDPLPVDLKLGGDEASVEVGDLNLKVLHTPGHSPGSVSAYVDIGGTRVLFGQDIHGPFHPDFGSDIKRWHRSMERLLEIEADILCEGHFGIYSPASAVRSYIESYLDRFR